jgi:hypothetical protein
MLNREEVDGPHALPMGWTNSCHVQRARGSSWVVAAKNSRSTVVIAGRLV